MSLATSYFGAALTIYPSCGSIVSTFGSSFQGLSDRTVVVHALRTVVGVAAVPI